MDQPRAQGLNMTPRDFTVAFIGDQGPVERPGSRAWDVLNLIKREGAEVVIHSGDFDYRQNPEAWNALITGVFGPKYPYFISFGNHDVGPREPNRLWTRYQQIFRNRLERIPEAACSTAPPNGELGVDSSCRYRGLFIVLSGVGTLYTHGIDQTAYIRNALAQDNSVWRICSWHKNRRSTQTGRKASQVAWGPYQACREGGAIIVNAHSHVYNRTVTLRRFQQDGAAAFTLDSEWTDPNVVRVGDGATFLVVSGLGGFGRDAQTRCLNAVALGGTECPEWASIYTANQKSQFGALFITFHVDGDPFKARGKFKNIDGEIVDRFTIHAMAGAE